jgi:plastocyanin
MRLRRRRLFALAGAALAVAPAAIGGPRVHIIEIRNMAFSPAPAGLKVGDVIEWVNQDAFRHTATARDGSFSVDLTPKHRARTKLDRPGEIAFFCRYHPGMTGALKVAP